MSKKKKIIIMSSLVFLLALTALLNVLLASNVIASGNFENQEAPVGYFETYRANRTVKRSQELAEIESVINLYEQGTERYEEAVDLKLKIVKMMENELLIENMVKSRGFSDAVVTIGLETDNVNVFVNSNELDNNTALSIYTMLVEELNVDPLSVIILPVYSQV